MGLSVALMVVMVHSEYEWLLLFGTIQYVLATGVGLIAGLTYQLGYRSAKTEPSLERVKSGVSPKIKYVGR